MSVSKKKKKKIIRLISNIFLVVAICLLNYPIGTDIFNALKTSRMYTEYNESVENLDLDITENEVKEYNQKLINNSNRLSDEKGSDVYEELLNIKNGIMCYVNCENAGIISVPVYHNTTTEILQTGAGHIAGTSLPSDQKGVHTAISGHSGMAGMKMFSQLPQVQTGDNFTISYLNKTLTYTVDKITTTLPDDTSPLVIDPEQNYCTLITCTPIGINTHRLIVRGVLTGIERGTTSTVYKTNGLSIKSLVKRFATYELVMTGISFILIIILITDTISRRKNKKNKKTKENNTQRKGNSVETRN